MAPRYLGSAWRKRVSRLALPSYTLSPPILELTSTRSVNSLLSSYYCCMLRVRSDILRLPQASVFEPNSRFTFFGSHYGKLKSIKEEYDPFGLFVVAKGVGSEDWDASLNCKV